jgi:hypothetical protein
VLHIPAIRELETKVYTYISRTPRCFSSMYEYYSSFKVWQHPCEAGFSASVSQWYTNWDHTTYEKCKDKPNAGAWRVTRTHDGAGCFMFFGPQRAWPRPGAQNNNKLGQCFVLDKVPVFRRCGSAHLSSV